MLIRIEANQRHGRGFQIHLMDGPLDKLYDESPLDFSTAVSYAGMLLDMINQQQGTNYEIGKVLQVSTGDLETGARQDIGAARVLHDAMSEGYRLSTLPGPDVRKDENGEYLISARGVVLLCLSSWKTDKNEKAWSCLRRYCEYISAHGRKGGATKALLELDGLSREDGVRWIKKTYARHVRDDISLVNYVMGA